MPRILELLQLQPSGQSLDYVQTKSQFHLFTLLTEQRHPRTWNVSFVLDSDTGAGLKMLLSVDQDVSALIRRLSADPGVLEQAVDAVVAAILSGRRVYVYGCGATGRLAKQMESSFWRPFWRRVRLQAAWKKLEPAVGADIEDRLTGEMTGADRALVSSLEGFEDLQLIGKLQLEDHGIRMGDVVICVTEGGETSSVIGTVLAALEQYGEDPSCHAESRRNLYFVCNNPPEVLRPFTRSATVLDSPGITRINLTTGPQAITGSTRLQATTSETFVVGAIIEEAVARVLQGCLDADELSALGYSSSPGLAGRLAAFERIKEAVDSAAASMARFTALELDTYRRGRFSTYFSKDALITVFIDNTERSPTFRLFPLDRVDQPERQCWVQVWTEAADSREAWINFLGRPFRGLDPTLYRSPFEYEVADPYLREAALRSLQNAGNDQEFLYDFSFSPANVERRGPVPGDLGVLVLVDAEVDELSDSGSSVGRFTQMCRSKGAAVAVLAVTGPGRESGVRAASGALPPGSVFVHVRLDSEEDPLTLRRQIALKMLLNAHSTAIMASLGKVIGNTMTNVSPSNLKLIGRATYLVQTHVNDILGQAEWTARHGQFEPVDFAEANAVVMDAIDYVRERAMGQTAEVAMSIIRIVTAFERRGTVDWDDVRQILDSKGLALFLVERNPALKSS
jgi:N-acetylmuramic acid 6-phosphate etherase